jgi:hypothetical protein
MTKTNRTLLFLIGVSALAVVASGENKARIKVQVIETMRSEYQRSAVVPGTASTTTTDCNITATVFGSPGIASANGHADCNSTSTPGRHAAVITVPVEWAEVHVRMPDNRRISVHCQPVFRACWDLDPGLYEADIHGNALLIFAHDLEGKERGIKFSVVGTWQERALQMPAVSQTRGSVMEAHSLRVAQARKRYSDYDQVMDRAKGIPITPQINSAIIEGAHGPDVAYYLAMHPDEVSRITALQPSRQFVEMGKLEAKFEITEEK